MVPFCTDNQQLKKNARKLKKMCHCSSIDILLKNKSIAWNYLVSVPYPSKLADKVMTTNTNGIPAKKKKAFTLVSNHKMDYNYFAIRPNRPFSVPSCGLWRDSLVWRQTIVKPYEALYLVKRFLLCNCRPTEFLHKWQACLFGLSQKSTKTTHLCRVSCSIDRTQLFITFNLIGSLLDAALLFLEGPLFLLYCSLCLLFSEPIPRAVVIAACWPVQSK